MIKTNSLGQMTASYAFKRDRAFKMMAASVAFLLLTIAHFVYFEFLDNDYDTSGRIGFVYVGLAAAAIGIRNFMLDMPVVHFTEDKFLFEPKENKITEGYWREVTEIAYQGAEILINYGDKKRLLLPASKLDLKGADLLQVAQKFQQNAQEKLQKAG